MSPSKHYGNSYLLFGRLLEDCIALMRRAEVVGECLAYNIKQYKSSQTDMSDISSRYYTHYNTHNYISAGAFWGSIRALVPLKKEVEELKKFTKDLKLVEAGVDPRLV